MALKKYALSQEQVFRAELMSFRLTLAVMLHAFLAGQEDRNAVRKEIEGAISQLATSLRLEAIPQPRQQTFRDLVIERGHGLVKDAFEMQREVRKMN